MSETPLPYRTNPYLATLFGVGLVGAAVGLIVVFVGNQAGASYPYEVNTDAVIIGGALFNLGVVAALLGLAAGAITWAIDRNARRA